MDIVHSDFRDRKSQRSFDPQMLHLIIIEDVERFGDFLKGDGCRRRLGGGGFGGGEGFGGDEGFSGGGGLLEAEIDLAIAFEVEDVGFPRWKWEGNPPCE